MPQPTSRTEIRRHPERGDHRDATVAAILDEGLVAHVGIAVDGQPYVIPMIYARRGATLYLHGSPASRLLRAMKKTVPVCVTVTLLDGLVLAKSAFHHSMNYRSVVVLGEAQEVTDPAEKRAAFAALVDHAVPGRSAEARPPNPKETAGTIVLALPLGEASAKIRTGPPIDDEADRPLPVWAGVIPLRLERGTPVPADGP
ncbi:MAG TPA: pyridoxamine 5'-phosphate oxidase family protein [Acidimicrobiia bacterium]|nr:pyridoxamine 5'-phosphate oxidase family protein [Acidimicrobiia bacterium]